VLKASRLFLIMPPGSMTSTHPLERRIRLPRRKRLIETIDTLGKANGEKANRNLALIYADHNWNPGRALELATAELEFRKDIYTYDALAWALYKNGRLDESAKAMNQAMKLKTPEPSFQQHAKLIQDSIMAAKQPKTAQEGQ